MKRNVIFLATLLFLASPLLPLTAATGTFTLILDPGHGGKDPGTLGKIGQEKSINLKVATLVGEMIEKEYPDVKVVYTRKSDIYVPLKERSDMANRADGDLFISIHTNSAEAASAHGAETYILGLSKTDANFDVAKRENAVLLLDGDKESYQGFDPNSPDSYIMFEFMQSKYTDLSAEVAYYIQSELVSIKRHDRGVRQAPFWVLHQVKMPSILVELGFISYSEEEKYLLSAAGQKSLANAIFKGFCKYKHEYDKRTVEHPSAHVAAGETAAAPAGNKSGITFRLQVFSSKTPIGDSHADMKKLKGHGPVGYTEENGWYKYTCGDTSDYNEILKMKKALKDLFPDAFVVAFKDGKKISVQEALKQQKK